MKRSVFGGFGLVVIAVIGILAYLSMFVVSQTEQALVLRFGNPVRVVTDAGLNFKLPLIDNVVYLDKRLLDLDSPPLEIIASDQKRLVVDAFGRYRIVDPLRFYQALGSIQIAQSRLSVVLNSAVRRVLGDASFIQLVRDQRAGLMDRITEQVDREARGLGVQVVDVKIRSADLPAANSQAIYQRMQTERQRQATEIRAQGEQAARQIRAEADRQATVIVAEANGQADELRGDGEAKRNGILANAFERDPEFFAFYRSLQAYQAGLRSNDTRLVISPDSEFFRYFNNPDAGGTLTVPTPGPAPTGARVGAELGATPLPPIAPDFAAPTDTGVGVAPVVTPAGPVPAVSDAPAPQPAPVPAPEAPAQPAPAPAQ